MNIEALQKQLQKQLLASTKLEIKDVKQFSIPIHTVDVSYHPVVRSAMDILMKMMLMTFKKTPVKHVELVADILFVEPLFIQDLTDKMLSMGMLTFDGVYTLTAKGESQLQAGIFEEQLELTTQTFTFSNIHQQFIEGDVENIVDLDDYPPLYDGVSETLHMMDASAMIAHMTEQLHFDDEEQQYEITEIVEWTERQLNDGPCLQFILYEAATKKYTVRVYNVFTESWDETLAQWVAEREIATYAAKYDSTSPTSS